MIKCEYLIDNNCTFERPVPTTNDVCNFCLGCDKPKQLNRATASLLVGDLLKNNQLDGHKHKYLIDILTPIEKGPGTELKKLISWFPIPNKTNCSTCRNLEIKMNRWGPEKCLEKIRYIVRKLEIAAKRRKLPFSEFAVTILVKRAIRNSK